MAILTMLVTTSDDIARIWSNSRSFYYQLKVHNLMGLAFKMDSMKITETLFNFSSVDYVQYKTQKPVEFLILIQSYLTYFVQNIFQI
jgi:hypothetical protein